MFFVFFNNTIISFTLVGGEVKNHPPILPKETSKYCEREISLSVPKLFPPHFLFNFFIRIWNINAPLCNQILPDLTKFN